MTDTEKDIAWTWELSLNNIKETLQIKKEFKEQQKEITKIRRTLIAIPISLLIGLLLGLLT